MALQQGIATRAVWWPSHPCHTVVTRVPAPRTRSGPLALAEKPNARPQPLNTIVVPPFLRRGILLQFSYCLQNEGECSEYY